MSYFDSFLAFMKTAEARAPFLGSVVFKEGDRVYAYGDAPSAYTRSTPVAEADRVHEDRPGMDEIVPVVRVLRPDFWRRVITGRNLGLGEAFIEGDFEMEHGSVWHLIAFCTRNALDKELHLSLGEKAKLFWLSARWRWEHSHNEDIADHYDMGDDVMLPMLGATGMYSCGYVLGERESLDQMQTNKLNLIFSKLKLKPGEHVLDTGCGNGGALVHAAQAFGVTGEGFTNSYNMARLSRENVHQNGLDGKIKIHAADFSLLERLPSESFDAIYEIGVWEHLPYESYANVMRECRRLLKPHGRMLLHSMGDFRRDHQRDEYIQKYIFRDSNQVILSRLVEEAERLGYGVADVENLGQHYYHTLWWWHKNLCDASGGVEDKRKLRIQQYFLQCGMAESRWGDGILYHLLVYKNPRVYRSLWRVTKEDMSHRAWKMRSNAENAVKLTSPDADQGKFDGVIYQRPSLQKRIARLGSLLFKFYH